MVDKVTHDDYMRLYKELVNRVEQKEKVIERMTAYIVKYAEKTNSVCKRSKIIECSQERCKKCVRDYFERGAK